MVRKNAITPRIAQGQVAHGIRKGFLKIKKANVAALKSNVGQGENTLKHNCSKKTMKPFNPSHKAMSSKGRKKEGVMFLPWDWPPE